MSRELSDPDFDIEVTLVNGQAVLGPNMHPVTLVRWVVACLTEPDRVMTDDCGGTYTGRDIATHYLTNPDGLRAITHADVASALSPYGWRR